MISLVTTACTLKCDNCKREFNDDTRHVFKTPQQAIAYAGLRGWLTDIQTGHAVCPECQAIISARYDVAEVRKALAEIARTYHPQAGDKDNKEKILSLLVQEMHVSPSEQQVLWKICTEYNLVWYDEYTGIFKINVSR